MLHAERGLRGNAEPRILQNTRVEQGFRCHPLAKFPTSLMAVCSKVHSMEHWHCGTLTTLPQREHQQGSLGNAELNSVKPLSSLQDVLRASKRLICMATLQKRKSMGYFSNLFDLRTLYSQSISWD